jgi:hypothetical protein
MFVVISILAFLLALVIIFYQYKKNKHLYEQQGIQKRLEHCDITEKECRKLLESRFNYILTENMRHLLEQRLLKAVELICRFKPLAFGYHSFKNDLAKSVRQFKPTTSQFNYQQAQAITPAERVKVQKYIKALRTVLRSSTSRSALSQQVLLEEDLQLVAIGAFFEVSYLLEKAKHAVELDQGGTVHYCCDQALKIITKHLENDAYWQQLHDEVTMLTNANQEIIRKATTIPVKSEDDWQMEYLFGTKKRYIE